MTSSTVTFSAGSDEEDLVLTIKADDDLEGDEQLLVTMSFGTEVPRHVLDELYKTTVVIADVDTPGKLKKLGTAVHCKLVS